MNLVCSTFDENVVIQAPVFGDIVTLALHAGVQ